MSELFASALDELTAAVRTTIDIALRAASWVLLEDEDDTEGADD